MCILQGCSGYLCAEQLYCGAAGNCEPLEPEGQACLDSTECATDTCREGICAKDTIISQELCSGVPG